MSMRKYDAIMIPGGGIRENGELPVWVKRRLDEAIKMHKEEFIVTLSAGTTHKPPPIDSEGFPIFESIAAAKYLMGKNIDPVRILTETSSYDTIGNAYFSRVVHVDPRGFRKLLIITSEFHLPRTEKIFEWIYGLDSPSPSYEMHFVEVPNIGIEKGALDARKKKEQESFRQLLELKENIRTLRQFHEWLFTEHGAYSLAVPLEKAIGEAVKTY